MSVNFLNELSDIIFFQIRYNTKVDVLSYTSIMAYGSGFRVNWDIKPMPIVVKVPIKNKLNIYKTTNRALHTSIESALDRYVKLRIVSKINC